MMRPGVMCVSAAFTLALFARGASAQSRGPCAVTGSVRDAAGRAVVRANVTLIQAASVTGGSSDSSGGFRVSADSGAATLRVRAIGFVAFETHLQAGAAHCVPLRLVLQPAVARLQPVRANGRRATPPTRSAPRVGSPWAEQAARAGRLAADGAGQLDQLVANTPGISGASSGESGFSVLGLPAAQSITSLNGAPVDLETLPPESGVLARVSTSPFDVGRGGFSGGELSLLVAPAGGEHRRRITVVGGSTAGAPNAAPGAVAPRGGLSGVVEGSLSSDYAGYRLSWSASQQSVPSLPLRQSARAYLQDPGILDSLDIALSAAHAKGILHDVDAVPLQRARSASVMFRADGLRWARNTPFLSVVENWRQSAGLLSAQLAPPSHGASMTSGTAVLQTGDDAVFGPSALNELTLTAARRGQHGQPESGLPDVDVRLSNGSVARASDLSLGGNAAAPRSEVAWSAEFNDAVSAYWHDEAHLTKLTLDARRRIEREESQVGNAGAYLFSSASDFIADRPAAYYWAGVGPAGSIRQDAYSAALGDEWDVTSSVHVEYGARADLQVITPDSRVASAWRVAATDWSPRAGVSWTPGRRDASELTGPLGILVRGGIGRFVGTVPSSTALGVVRDGVATGALQLVCTGKGVPAPEWTAFLNGAAAPQSCAAPVRSSTNSPWRESSAFSGRFAPPSAWRGEAGASFPLGVRVDLDAMHSVSSRQMTSRDLNLVDAAAFALSAEGGRPVLVSPGSIDPATGLADPAAARRDPTSGPHLEFGSDAVARAWQFTISLSPERAQRISWSAIYAYESAQNQQPELAYSSTGERPDVRYVNTWSRSPDEMRHELLMSVSAEIAADATVSVFYSGRSGLPYTPVVQGDVDGDGLGGDRAFVLAPGGEDSAAASAIQSLLGAAPRRARRCLARQVGRLAARNSCVGPWIGDATLQLEFPGDLLRFSRLASARIQLVNVLAGADLLLHGLGGARGWGAGNVPDPVLLRPTGFDPISKNYVYQVNSHFGLPLAQGAAVAAPFTIAVALQASFGRSPDEERLRTLLRAPRTDTAKVSSRLASVFGHAAFNCADALLRDESTSWSDSTKAALRRIAAHTEHTSDSLWRDAARIVMQAGAGVGGHAVAPPPTRGKSTRESDMLAAVREARDSEFRAFIAEAIQVNRLLQADHIQRLPVRLEFLLDPRALDAQRKLADRSGRGR